MCFAVKRDLRQLYALLFKDLTLHWRQWKSNLCTCLTPIIVMVFIYLLQLLITYGLGSIPAIKKREESKGKRVNFFPANLVEAGGLALLRTNTTPPEYLLWGTEVGNDPSSLAFGAMMENALSDVPGQGFVGGYSLKFNFTPGSMIDEYLYEGIEAHSMNSSVWFPYAGALKIESVQDEIDFILETDIKDQLGGGPSGGGGFMGGGGGGSFGGSLDSFCGAMDLLVGPNGCPNLAAAQLLDAVANAWIRNKTNASGTSTYEGAILTRVAGLPYKSSGFVFSINLADMSGSFFYPMILLLVLPTVLYTLVIEKESQLKEMMRLMGLRECNYVFETYCFKFCIYVLVCLLFSVLGIALGHRLFSQTTPLVLILTFIGDGLMIVSFAFFLSSFIANSFVATIIGYVVVLFTPVIGILLNQFLMSAGAYEYKPLLIIPPLPLTDAIYHLTQACNDYQCLGLTTWFYNYDFVCALGMTYFDALLFFLLALYLEQVTPKTWGIRQNVCFCFTWICQVGKKGKEGSGRPCCCCCPGGGIDGTDPDLLPLPNEEEEIGEERLRSQDASPEELGIVVRGLVKQFGRGKSKNVAVKGVHFVVNHGECFGLLGPNGAGKTTTIRMLSGLFGATKGTAYVGGHSTDRMDLVRQSLGLCPQFSVVWKELTPTEHLLFYCRLKGVPVCDERVHVLDILRKVGLDPNDANKPPNCCQKLWRWFFPNERKAFQLSGGMVRRLSIGISLCGDPSVLLLDEPTTGLDPDVRRSIWDLIMEEKKSRCVILTTHSMEEADALSDRIGIMSHGRLICLGSSLHLKAKYGNGYTLSLKYDEQQKDALDAFLLGQLNSMCKVIPLKAFGNSAHFELRPLRSSHFRVSEIFELLTRERRNVGILDFEMNQTTLEDVFLNVISREEQGSLYMTRRASSFYQMPEIEGEAEDVKDMQMYSDSAKVVEIEDIESVGESVDTDSDEMSLDHVRSNDAISSDVGVEESGSEASCTSSSSELEEDEAELAPDAPNERTYIVPNGLEPEIRPPSTASEFVSFFSESFTQVWVLLWKECVLSLRGWPSSLLLLSSPFFVVLALFALSMIYNANKPATFLHDEIHSVSSVLPPCTAWAGGDCYQLMFTVNGGGNPVAKPVMDSIVADFGWVAGVDYLEFPWELWMLEYIFLHPNETTIALSFDNKTSLMFRNNMTLYTLYYNSTDDIASPIVPFKLLIDDRIYYETQQLLGETVPKKSFDAQQQGFPRPPNRMLRNGQSMLFDNTGPLFFSLAAMLLFLISMYKVVREKELDLRSGLEMIGMRQCSYFCSWFVVFVGFAFLMSIVTIVSGYIFVIDVFLYCNPLLMFTIVFVFDVSLVFFAFALSTLVNKTKAALVMGFIVLALTFILNLFLANGTIVSLLFSLDGEWLWVPYVFQVLYPPFNFGKAFSDVVSKTVKTYDADTNEWLRPDGYTWANFVESRDLDLFGDEYVLPPTYQSILYMLLNATIYFVVYLILDYILWTKKHFACPRCCCAPPRINEEMYPKTEREKNDDEDLVAEYHAVRSDEHQTALRLANLKKTFHAFLGCGKRVEALKGVCVTANRGECTSFLGHNGAGKTTTIRCIAGLEVPSSGGVVVHDSLHVSTDLRAIRRMLGVCVQGNLLWDHLSAREHLWLFSTIRGMKWCSAGLEGQHRLEDVSLTESARSRSGTFSGGMKRRLNVAMGFVGTPQLVLLDEPTTGLDPFSKREVWELIKKKKRTSAILLTTHSMEEADALSDKIVIMHQGRIRCLGDSLHLKSKFGAGYVLKFRCDMSKPENESMFQDLIAKLFPHAVLISSNAGNSIFSLRPEFMDELISGMRDVEDRLEAGDGLICDFGLSHDTLETIYMKVTREGDDEENERGKKKKKRGRE